MNSDIRIAMSCADHPKILKLIRKAGGKSFWHLIKLWCFVAENKPDGNLSCYDIDDIEIAAGWNGDPGLFFDTLVELKLIDKVNGHIYIHDWQENQPWASGAKQRSAVAKKNQLKRWIFKALPNKREKENFSKWYESYAVLPEDSTERILAVYERYSNGNTPILSFPSPFPPDDKTSHQEEKKYIGARPSSETPF